ncbi:transposase, partial [Streptomyces sp. NPDC002722]|uniref:transposase n=1 Tax=Streptomyces sp. NPDC002722 TaxID=3154425 RepID=UPI003318EC79
MKNYPPQFKADAVALYESRPEATIRSVAADLEINPKTLQNWMRAAGVRRPRGRRTQEPAQVPTPLENAALRKKVRELEEKRENLAEVSPHLTDKIMRFGEYYELDLAPEAYEPHLEVDFTVPGGDRAAVARGGGELSVRCLA